MADVPSGALAGAAVAARALAGLVQAFTASLPLPEAAAAPAQAACRRIALVEAPRVTSARGVAAIGSELVTVLQSASRAAEPADASAGLYDLAAAAQTAFPASASPVLTRLYTLARALAAAMEVAALGEAFVAEARTEFADRRAATEARTRITEQMAARGDRIATVLGQEIFAVLSTAARETSAHLVRQATSLQPVVRVDAGRSFPSTAIAWNLYGDPARAEELVARNRAATPLFMPASFEALAPSPA